MKKAYLLVYSSSLGTPSEVKQCVDSLAEVTTWRTDLPNSFYLVSEHKAVEVARAIRKYFHGRGRFFVTEITDNRWGWLPPKTWHLLRHKQLEKDRRK